ncbi:helix-turn-helix domain-containing protein [Pectobacterium sp. CHL-2024]|uniref:helix-turn-helix domain-containing protein n=1 Tax=Pectobacterium sp. CHL-2024 TaxID=3377079 RepID=UPI0037FA29CD
MLCVWGYNTESIGVPAVNVSNWGHQDSVPGSAFVKCALDTGSALYWLTTGKFANANLKEKSVLSQVKALYDEILSSGGKPVLRRIMDAYGFTLQKQLCDLLGISSGTVSKWVRRDYFPGDVVVTCALDTGVSFEWITIGKGTSSGDAAQSKSASYSELKKYNIGSDVLEESGEWICDKSIINSLPENCGFVEKAINLGLYILNKKTKEVNAG